MELRKITKKMFAFVFLFVVTLNVIPVNAIIAATPDFTLTLEADKTSVQPGDTVTVSVNVPAGTNMAAYSFSLLYDNTKVSTTNAKCSTPLKIQTAVVQVKSESGQVNVAEMGAISDDVVKLTEAGTILQAQFTVLEGAAGNIEFGIKDNAKFKTPNPDNEEDLFDLNYAVQNNTKVFVEAPLVGISLNKSIVELNVGESSEAINVIYNPENTTASDAEKAITWTSNNENIATIENGVVTAVAPGSTQIRATTGNGKYATCEITVKAPITSIELYPVSTELNEGESSLPISVVYRPSNTTDVKEVTWTSSDNNVATVNTSGVVTGVKAGSATITATTANGKSATCEITVKAPLTGIALNKSTASLEVNGEDTLVVSYDPENTTDNKQVTWISSDPSIVRIEEINESSAKIIGANVTQRNTPVTITAQVGSYTKTCQVTVTVPVSSVSISEQNVSLKRKITGQDTATLTAVVDPEGALQNADVEWVSADTNIATVAKADATTATVTAVADGTVEIKATIGGKEAKTTITVTTPVQSISLSKSSARVKTGEEVTLSVIYNPTDVTESLKEIIWESSDPTRAIVVNGVVTTLKPTESGNPVVITARSKSNNSAVATCDINIDPIPLEGVQIVEDRITLEKGTEKTLTGKCLPENTTDNTDLRWTSSNTNVATVNENTGKVTAIGAGTATITATSKTNNALSDSCEVSVTVRLTGLKLDNTKITLTRGVTGQDEKTLVATPEPSDTTDTSNITWTSGNTAIATVDANGKVTAVGPGTTQIKATKGSFIAICEVEVKVPLTSISLNKSNTEILIKQSETLVVTYNPTDTNDNRTINWTSSDESIATVDANGKVTAKAEGTVTITATSVVDKSITATCQVTTKRIPLDSIALSEANVEMLKGKTVKLSVICNPDNTTDNRDVNWVSSDESTAIVDENGNVTALKEGNVTITATSKSNSALTASCDIEITEVHIESISIDKDNIDNSLLMAGKSFKLSFKLNPDIATDNYSIVWTSSDPSIATIDENGNVTALKEGNVKFTAFITNEYGDTFEDTYELYIKPEEVSSLSPETGDANIALLVVGMIISLGAILFVNKKRKSIKDN